ncbi:UPF0669 protein C6orf120 homolog [Leptidea sinapis]|uniref:UPF0669 protein C6orf120 homolog n=1 Tax=Leptidea sinapis TaxID=189913 RepID=UPI00212CFB53|nr:UPF0669 protein C6orf120 homolog [Leptidea sinapis]
MRREFIFLLLAIITGSTIWSLVSNVFRFVFMDKMLLDTVIGAVGAGNFSYWQLGHGGPLLVELTSLSGDADLYVADNLRPSYEVDRHNFSSITCGPDVVSIPADFPRPVGIGVFGAWSHSVSAYSIHVFLDRSDLMSDVQMITIEHVPRYHNNYDAEDEETIVKSQEYETTKSSSKWSDSNNTRYMRLLHFLDMVVDMYIL